MDGRLTFQFVQLFLCSTTTTYTFLNHSTDCTFQRFKITKEEMEQLAKLLDTKASSKCRDTRRKLKKDDIQPATSASLEPVDL